MAKTPGDEEFIAFVAAHADRLVRTAELMCGDRGRAEDLVQSALERTYLRWHKVDHEDPYGYVYRAVVNGNRDWWRRSRGREQSVPAPPERVVADRSDDVAVRDAVLSALAGLTRRERAVVVLRYYEDRSEADIADLLGVAAGTVKSTAARALAKLRTHPELALDQTLPPADRREPSADRTLQKEETR